ncbi:hypothetical protein EVAR_43024_1 [Eumeta japonica]|uniref:Uncharacterized protein n=1 Tax=Eumeta variegata TaxID=151549 RepID=A0A4C1XKP1_EUMVA|nr:hypothetical protein EVAR_43024_1 [Eumeta japonica]
MISKGIKVGGTTAATVCDSPERAYTTSDGHQPSAFKKCLRRGARDGSARTRCTVKKCRSRAEQNSVNVLFLW